MSILLINKLSRDPQILILPWFLFSGCNKITKMYGVNSELAKRMERRLREKIYREMIEQQELFKKQMAEEKPHKHHQVKTEPDYDDTRYSKKKWNQEHPRNLQQQSTFLPLIHQKPSRYLEAEDQGRYSTAYRKYLSRRNGHSENVEKYNRTDNYPDNEEEKSEETLQIGREGGQEGDLNQQKTRIYLEQCEEIISNLKHLTSKGSRKVKPRSTKYDVDQTFLKRKADLTKSFKFEKGFSQRVKSSTPNGHSFLAEQPFSVKTKREKTQSYSINSLRQNTNEGSLNNSMFKSEDLNEFSEFNDQLWQKSNRGRKQQEIGNEKKKEAVKQNHRRIEPIPKGPEEEEVGQSEDDKKSNRFVSSRNTIEQKKQNQSKVGQSVKEHSRVKAQEAKPSKQIKNAGASNQGPYSISPKEQGGEEDPETVRKRQNAILKYLKKARACGNLLYKKVEGRKKTSDENCGNEEIRNTVE